MNRVWGHGPWVVAGLLLCPFIVARSATIRVPGNQPTLQQGIDAAANGDTVLVAPGTYLGDGNRDLQIVGKTVSLVSEGGAGATTIDCEWVRRVVTFTGVPDTTALIQGFTCWAGYAWEGGAILLYESSPAIKDCVFTYCTAEGRGGAIHCDGTSRPTIRRCLFWYDGSPYGGAVSCDMPGTLVSDSHFADNGASRLGGAIYACFLDDVYLSAPLVVRRCRFERNECAGVGDGGAIYIGSAASDAGRGPSSDERRAARNGVVSVVDTDFVQNTTNQRGGAVCVMDPHVRASFERCLFDASIASSGGALWNVDGADGWTEVTHCTFTRNRSWHNGGAIRAGSYAIVGECTFSGNSATTGAGVYIAGSHVSVARTVIALSTSGGSIYCVGGSPQILHNVLYANTGGDVVCGWEADNLFTDPLFCDASSDDYSVCSDSPCVPAYNPWGELVGAHDVGCGSCNVVVRPTSWGAIKSLFR